MLTRLGGLFKGQKHKAEQAFLLEHNIQRDDEQGFIVDGIVVNSLSARLQYFSSRKLSSFDDLRQLFYTAILINEKIDLEIASGRYNHALGNTEENLQQLKTIIQKLNAYYRQFLRDQ
ncbi:hypothetical protein [Acinetobacter sp. WZC-1]|uniref:hypothetical protein n=1 Tax=Acinetobacter sp. WZC-1 TaxID=3459034 RepID=UPI00403DB962